jgi:hypothetical protein
VSYHALNKFKIFSSKVNPKVEGVSFENIISFNVHRSGLLIVRLIKLGFLRKYQLTFITSAVLGKRFIALVEGNAHRSAMPTMTLG